MRSLRKNALFLRVLLFLLNTAKEYWYERAATCKGAQEQICLTYYDTARSMADAIRALENE